MNMSPERNGREYKEGIESGTIWLNNMNDWTQISVDDFDSGQDPIMIVGG